MEGARFAGKIAIVTGGGNGIGRSTAQRLAAEGATVAIFDLNGDAAQAVADGLPRASAHALDVADETQVKAAIDAVAKAHGGIDILVNNAGGSLRQPGPFWEIPTAELRRITDVNYLSQWFCTVAAMPAMRGREGAAIVNISSGSGVRSVDGMAAYGAAKAAVINFTHAAARELGPLGIRVNAIAPGFIRFGRNLKAFTEEQAARIEERGQAAQALKQIGEPEDVAATIAYLCSADARHVSGITMEVNGGT